MSKPNFFVKYLKSINQSINSLLEKNLNKLNFNNFINLARSNKIFLTFVALIFLFLSYLSIPYIYNKEKIKNELESQLINKFNINFILPKNFEYKFLPRPHFIIKDIFINENEQKIFDVNKTSIFISLNNLFSINNIKIDNVVFEEANFNLNKQNSNLFIKLLDNDYSKSNLNIKNSKIFFRSFENEILLINKVDNLEYYYDLKEFKNVVISENEIFNIPYSIKIYKERLTKNLFSKVNLNFLKLQLINELDYSDDLKKGLINFIYNKKKSEVSYEFDAEAFNFYFLDKSIKPNFAYKGKINFNPFYSLINGNIDEINLSTFFQSNSIFFELLKTEILNNKNLNFDLKIKGKKYFKIDNINDFNLDFKIQEGLIDIDNTNFKWINHAVFEVLNSLIYVKENQLILDCKIIIDIKNHNEIYKFLQIPKNSRPVLNRLEIDINYNFDEQTLNFKTVKIDNQINKRVNEVLLKKLLKREEILNKVYFKSTLKKAIIAYAG